MGSTWLTCAMGRVLREKRFERKLSLATLSRLTGFSVAQLSKLERGTVDADLLTLDRVTAVLGLTLDELVQLAHFADDERIVFIGSELLAQPLKCPFRDVVIASNADDAREIIKSWRADCVIVADPSPDLLVELRHGNDHHAPLNSAVNLCVVTDGTEYSAMPNIVYSTVDELVSTVNQLLLRTRRGHICNLRRIRQNSVRRREKLKQDRSRLTVQVEQLSSHLSHISSDLADEQKQKLTARIERLRAIKESLILHEHAVEDQERFLRMREFMAHGSWLMAHGSWLMAHRSW